MDIAQQAAKHGKAFGKGLEHGMPSAHVQQAAGTTAGGGLGCLCHRGPDRVDHSVAQEQDQDACPQNKGKNVVAEEVQLNGARLVQPAKDRGDALGAR